RLFMFASTFGDASSVRASATKFNAWREHATAFEDIAAYQFTAVDLTDRDRAEQVTVGRVSAPFFRLFGASTSRGRTFTDDEDRPNAARVAVLDHGFWTRRLGADPAIVGRAIDLAGTPHTVIGILAPGFRMVETPVRPDVWVPAAIARDSTDGAHLWRGAGRLKTGRSLAEGMAQLREAADDFRGKYFDLIGATGGFGAVPYQEAVVWSSRRSLLLLSGAVVFVLLIACANVANLLLVRATQRGREMAIRSAIP